MRFLNILLLLVFLSCTVTGCETAKGAAKGFKQDVQNVKSQDGWLWKADDWFREKMW